MVTVKTMLHWPGALVLKGVECKTLHSSLGLLDGNDDVNTICECSRGETKGNSPCISNIMILDEWSIFSKYTLEKIIKQQTQF